MELDTVSNKFVKTDASSGQKIEGLIGDSLFFFIPPKVELPGVDWVGYIAFFICDWKTDLNHFGFLYISTNENVFLVLFAVTALAILASSSCDDTWELCVLC